MSVKFQIKGVFIIGEELLVSSRILSLYREIKNVRTFVHSAVWNICINNNTGIGDMLARLVKKNVSCLLHSITSSASLLFFLYQFNAFYLNQTQLILQL